MMSHQNLLNGIPPQMGQIRQSINDKPALFNGIHSSQSSRDSSPSQRPLGYGSPSGQIPATQLPPAIRSSAIPTSQLPPSPSTVSSNIMTSHITPKIGQLSVNNSQFSTSTPTNQITTSLTTTVQRTSALGNSAFSPITSKTDQQLNAQSVVAPIIQPNRGPINGQPNPVTVIAPAVATVAPLQNMALTSNQNSSKIIQNRSPINSYNHSTPQKLGPIQQQNQGIYTLQNPAIPQPQHQQQQNRQINYNNTAINNHHPSAEIGSQFPLPNVPRNLNQIPQQPNYQKPVPPSNQGIFQPQQNLTLNQNTPVTQQINHHLPATSQNLTQYNLLNQQQQQKTNLHTNRYPQPQPALSQNQQYQQQFQNYQQQQPMQKQQPYQSPITGSGGGGGGGGVTQMGFNRLWGHDNIDLLQNPNILPADKLQTPRVYLGQETLDAANCSPDLFRSTMTKIPESNSLLQKSRLPLGVLIHPFKDLAHLPVIQCHVIVRCRACRTYINPFVFFVDSKRWKCNLCYRVNDLPEEFQYDPVTKTYGDPSRRPEIKASTIEYIAPAEYMLRPPQPAVYLYLFDISRLAIESGYLQSACSVLLEELKNIPGDARTQVGIVAYDSALHFFSLGEGLSQPHEMTVLDIDDVFLPCPDNLLINLKDRMDLLVDLLTQLPSRYNNCFDNNSALGAALQAGHKMMSATGGRITVFQASLPNVGPGALLAREDPNERAATEVTNLNPANDFYKRLALECSAQQIAVDLFILNSQYVDIATISGISQFSGGCIHHFALFKASKVLQNERFERCFRRYLIRKVGFEAVMRIRCTRGLSIHTFHGNFFVRSTDLLSLPNINPDAGFGMQVSIDENLSDVQTVCFQAALLYTSSKGERRIRVHTMCLPVSANLSDIINSADQQCIIGLLAKMAVDRSLQSSLSDAREAFINVAIDILSSYKLTLNMGNGNSSLLAPQNLKLLPLYISALLKFISFRVGSSTRLDDRVKAMIDMKTKPLSQLIQLIYPDLYPVHNLEIYQTIITPNEEEIPQPAHLQLTARVLDSKGAFLMDLGEHMILLIGPGIPEQFLNQVLGVTDYSSITDDFYELPILDNVNNLRLHRFINYLNDDKPFAATLHIIRDNSPNRVGFYEHLIEDRMENALSYHEFLQHIKTQIK